MNIKINERRLVGADLIRVIACFSVLSVHFFLYTGFYYENLYGTMLPFLFIRTFSMICVPLFMILTGYLMNGKTLSAAYYRKGIKTPVIYVLAGLVCVLFNAYMGVETSRRVALLSFFNFSAAPYAWYVEMYLGLFLLIPFLNLSYHHLADKKQKQILLVTLFLLTSLPSVLNIFNFSGNMPWSLPTAVEDCQVIFPQWWKGIYPLFYYFVGAYISEYGVKIKRWFCRLVMLLFVAAHTLFCLYRSGDGAFVWGTWSDWGSPLVAVPAVMMFILCVQKSNDKFPKIIKRLLALLSDLSLGTYLVSYIFDYYLYYSLNGYVESVQKRMIFYFILVPVNFIASMFISYILEKIYFLLKTVVNITEKKIRQRRKAKALPEEISDKAQ